MNSLMHSGPRKHLITVEEYYRMAEVGLLAPEARVELIEGEIIDMVPIGSRHNRAVTHLTRVLTLAVGDLAIVQPQGPVRLGPRSEPEPDIAVLAPRADEYGAEHPSASEVLLLIEVSDSTLHHDLEVKVPLYARNGIHEVWIVDLQNSAMHFYGRPEAGNYMDHRVMRTPGVTYLTALPGVAIDLSRLLLAG
jgi:Uma2 family endonuclease